jgi:transposase
LRDVAAAIPASAAQTHPFRTHEPALGFGLARALAEARIECVVVAPSKLIRPAGDRVKTDVSDAAHLTRLLRLGEITAVTVPEADVEAVRDLCAPVRMLAPT